MLARGFHRNCVGFVLRLVGHVYLVTLRLLLASDDFLKVVALYL